MGSSSNAKHYLNVSLFLPFLNHPLPYISLTGPVQRQGDGRIHSTCFTCELILDCRASDGALLTNCSLGGSVEPPRRDGTT